MKTMSCRQMGGPCDEKISGETAEDMMMNGAAHVTMKANEGDAAHAEVQKMMDEMRGDKAGGDRWFAEFKEKFDAL